MAETTNVERREQIFHAHRVAAPANHVTHAPHGGDETLFRQGDEGVHFSSSRGADILRPDGREKARSSATRPGTSPERSACSPAAVPATGRVRGDGEVDILRRACGTWW